jgi:FAD-dependent oxidoreductase domain-containing protein 1
MNNKADVIIIGGGVIGSSIAYNLLKDGFDGQIIIFEKDEIYEHSSTPRSVGGVRQLFTTDINIQISKYSLQTYRNFPEEMAIDGELAEIDFKQRGYLFLATPHMLIQFEKHQQLHHQYNVPSQLLDNRELLHIIPELNIEDLAGGLYCAEDGYLDPYSVMKGYIRYAKKLGAKYVYDEVETLLTDQHQISGVRVAGGEEFYAPTIINCAGAWGPSLSEKIGLPLPVVPLRRQVFPFDIAQPLTNPLPLTIDPSGVYFRHEGQHLLCGVADDVKAGIDFGWKRSIFEEHLWPTLAHRVPNFEQAKVQRGWSGLYDHNTQDHNAIIGQHPEMKGYYVAFGFSGHGMQQAPAVGKGMSELIRLGKYDTIDLSPLRVERFAENDLVIEDAVV